MKLKNIVPVLGIVLIGLAIALWPTPHAQPLKDALPYEDLQRISVTLSIEGSLRITSAQAAEHQTILDVLKKLDETDPTLKLKTKTYEGLGTLVDSMNGLHNGDDNKYWQYKVNDIAPQVGADQYELLGGEHIEWYFDESEF